MGANPSITCPEVAAQLVAAAERGDVAAGLLEYLTNSLKATLKRMVSGDDSAVVDEDFDRAIQAMLLPLARNSHDE